MFDGWELKTPLTSPLDGWSISNAGKMKTKSTLSWCDANQYNSLTGRTKNRQKLYDWIFHFTKLLLGQWDEIQNDRDYFPMEPKEGGNIKIELWRDFVSFCALRLTDSKGKLQPPLTSRCLAAVYQNKETFSALLSAWCCTSQNENTFILMNFTWTLGCSSINTATTLSGVANAMFSTVKETKIALYSLTAGDSAANPDDILDTDSRINSRFKSLGSSFHAR